MNKLLKRGGFAIFVLSSYFVSPSWPSLGLVLGGMLMVFGHLSQRLDQGVNVSYSFKGRG